MGANLVKRNLDPVEKTDLEKAGEAQDKFVATIGDVVVRKLAAILEDGENEVARVSAAKVLLDWIRPQKGGVNVNINNAPTYTSHLNLPEPQPVVVEAIDVTPVERQKVLPEPAAPMSQAKLTTRTDFAALRELQAAHAPDVAKAELSRAQSPTQRTPDKPLPASSVKMFQ